MHPLPSGLLPLTSSLPRSMRNNIDDMRAPGCVRALLLYYKFITMKLSVVYRQVKRILLSLLTIAVCSQAGMLAQTQSGYVKTPGRLGSNSKVTPGTRISGATIAIAGHNAVVSSQQGAFSFPVSGNKFTINNISKSGYMLVDKDALKQYTVSNNPLILLMTSTKESED
jgi:hypothetical protein